MQTRELYVSLFSQKVSSPDQFIDQITNPEHPFYGASREYAREIMEKDTSWQWLAGRLDDFAIEIEKIVSKKVQKWKFKALLGASRMPMCSTEKTITWMMNRMISEYQTICDKRSRNYVNVKKVDRELRMLAIEAMAEDR